MEHLNYRELKIKQMRLEAEILNLRADEAEAELKRERIKDREKSSRASLHPEEIADPPG